MFTSAEKLSICCIKMREREKGGEREKETDLKLKKLSSRFELLVGHALNRLLTVKLTAMKVRFASGVKEQVRCLSSNLKEPNTDKLRDKLGEISGMELSSF